MTMKKLLILLLLSTSFSTFSSSHFSLHYDFSSSDFCYRQPNVQDRGGVYYFPNEEVGITASSLCVFKNAFGQYASKGKLIKGNRDGKWTWWYTNGQKLEEENYKDGKKEGKSTYWYDNGNMMWEHFYKDDKRDGKWTSWFEDKHVKKYTEDNYKNGKKNGKSTEWYLNGEIRREGNYKDDKADGKWIFWSEDGQTFTEATYKDGVCISGDCY